MTPQDGAPRWEPVPVPQGDGRHDIGDDVRAAIVQRLMSDWSHDPDLTPAKVRQLAMWAGASVRALLHEIGTLRDMTAAPPASLAPGAPDIPALIERLRTHFNDCFGCQQRGICKEGEALVAEAADALTALSASHEALTQRLELTARDLEWWKTDRDIERTKRIAAEAQVSALTAARDKDETK
jgi:hypothetical protein